MCPNIDQFWVLERQEKTPPDHCPRILYSEGRCLPNIYRNNKLLSRETIKYTRKMLCLGLKFWRSTEARRCAALLPELISGTGWTLQVPLGLYFAIYLGWVIHDPSTYYWLVFYMEKCTWLVQVILYQIFAYRLTWEQQSRSRRRGLQPWSSTPRGRKV